MNIVFDLGNVVVAWNAQQALEQVFESPEHRILAKNHVVAHPDWGEFDRGTLGLMQLAQRAARRTGLPEEQLYDYAQRAATALTPIEATIALMPKLLAQGCRLFCLSNMSPVSYAYLQQHMDFWRYLEGQVISSHLGFIKPEPAIYQHLLSAHQLPAEHTIFIDDLEINIVAARQFGIKTVHFHSSAQCEDELRQFGALI